jgi:hypothetical protein
MERLDEFQEQRCEWFVRRKPLAEVPDEYRELLCMWFVCREPLAERLWAFMEHPDEFQEALCEWFMCRKPLAERLWPFVENLDEFQEARCEWFVCRKPLAERLWSFMERLDAFQEERCEWFVCRKPLAEVPYEYRETLCMWFVCREPLAEMLHAFGEARCEWFTCRKPLAAVLYPFQDERNPFEEPLCEGRAGRNPRAERPPSHRDDASLRSGGLLNFSSWLNSNSRAARVLVLSRSCVRGWPVIDDAEPDLAGLPVPLVLDGQLTRDPKRVERLGGVLGVFNREAVHASHYVPGA